MDKMAWKEDGSGQLVLDGAKVTNIGGKKANAMWVDGQGGAGQWTFTLGPSGQGGVWVGVAEEERFGPGYQVKGLMFGGPGNLSDGSALIAGHWGPKVEAGDRLDMRLEVDDGDVVNAQEKTFSRSLTQTAMPSEASSVGTDWSSKPARLRASP